MIPWNWTEQWSWVMTTFCHIWSTFCGGGSFATFSVSKILGQSGVTKCTSSVPALDLMCKSINESFSVSWYKYSPSCLIWILTIPVGLRSAHLSNPRFPPVSFQMPCPSLTPVVLSNLSFLLFLNTWLFFIKIEVSVVGKFYLELRCVHLSAFSLLLG